MRKKVLPAALLALTLGFSLTACSGADSADSSSSVQPQSSSSGEEASSESTSETSAESEPEETPEPEVTEEPEETSDVSAASEPSSSQGTEGSADISSAVEGNSSTEEAPIAVGQWATIADYSAEDETYHNVYVRVTKVTTSSADAAYVQEAVDQSNANGSYYQVDLTSEDYQVPEDVEWCVLDYEVFVPENYPSPEYGITEPTMNFSETNVGGGGIPSADGTSTYIGLGTNNIDLQNNPSDIKFSVGKRFVKGVFSYR